MENSKRHTLISRWIEKAVVGLLLATLSPLSNAAYKWVDKEGKIHYSDQAPPEDAVSKEEKNFTNLKAPAAAANKTYEQERAIQLYPVTLFVIPDCKGECTQARSFLDKNNITYKENVVSSPADIELYTKETRFSEVVAPVLKIGAKVLRGLDQPAWQAQLEATGHLRKPSQPSSTQEAPAPTPAPTTPPAQRPPASVPVDTTKPSATSSTETPVNTSKENP